MRKHPNDNAVKAAFDRYHKSTSPKLAADRQLRSELRQAGVKPEFEEDAR